MVEIGNLTFLHHQNTGDLVTVAHQNLSQLTPRMLAVACHTKCFTSPVRSV